MAGVAGLLLAALTTWWLLLVGAAALAAAWAYTGTSRPYGYLGLGELFVFVFFGLVAVVGTTYVQAGTVTTTSVLAGVGIGSLACALLVANNLRDVPTDAAAGKRTLAVRLGESRTRVLYAGLHLSALAALAVLAARSPEALLGLVAAPLQLRAVRTVLRGARGTALVPVLRDTSLAELAWAGGLSIALFLP